MRDTQSESRTDLDKAWVWGTALGSFMGMVSYGITHPRFSNSPELRELSAEILAVSKETVKTMKMSDKKLPLSFIRRRVEQIAREHQKQLALSQKKLIVQIAAIFAT